MARRWLRRGAALFAWTCSVRNDQTFECAFAVDDAATLWGASGTFLMISSSLCLVKMLSSSSAKVVTPPLHSGHSVQSHFINRNRHMVGILMLSA